MSKTIAITGANSYLGDFIVNYLLKHSNCKIIALVSPRWEKTSISYVNERVQIIKADLTKPLSDAIRKSLNKTNRVFHFAWVRGSKLKKIDQINQKMIHNIIETISNPADFFLISSVAGSPRSLSYYGKTKYNSTKLLHKLGGNTLVCGLVVENNPVKGPYKLFNDIVSKLPIAIRLKKREPLVFPIQIEDIGELITSLIDRQISSGIYRLFGTPIRFNDFITQIESKYPKKRIILRFSTKFILNVTYLTKKIHIFPTKICEQILTFFYKDEEFLLNLNEIELDTSNNPESL